MKFPRLNEPFDALSKVDNAVHRNLLSQLFARVKAGDGRTETAVAELSYGGPSDVCKNGVCDAFGGAEFEAIAAWLATNAPVKKLDLRDHTSLDDEALRVLVEGLAANENVDELSLQGTAVGDIRPLIQCLQERNNSLTAVTIDNTPAAALDETTLLQLRWALLGNAQPLRLKTIVERLRNPSAGSTSALAELVLDDQGGSRPYDDISLLLVVSALLDTHPWCAAGDLSRRAPVSSNRTVTSLKLTNGAFTATGARLLADYLKCDRVVQKLDFSGSVVGSHGVAALAKALTPPQGNTSVLELDLSYTGCTGDGCGAEVAAMVASNETLRVVRLCGNDLCTAGRLLSKAFHTSTTLVVLDLRDCLIEERYMEVIDTRSSLQKAPSLLMKSLPKLHANVPSLTSINLTPDENDHGVCLNDRTLLLLLEALSGNTMLTELNISNNPITSVGLCCLAASLVGDMSSKLVARNMQQKEPGAETAAPGLEKLSIRGLRLLPCNAQEVEMGTTPALYLADLILGHPCLTWVDAGNNFLEEGAGATLLSVAKRERRLKYLRVDNTPVGEDVRRKLEIVLPLHNHEPAFADFVWAAWTTGIPEDAESESKAEATLQLSRVIAECGSSRITGVDFADHKLGDAAAAPLVNLLRTCEFLEGLVLANTAISSTTAIALAGVIQDRVTIRYADVSRNPRVDESAKALVHAQIRFNIIPPPLKHLLSDIEHNRVSEVRYANPEPDQQLNDESVSFVAKIMQLASVLPRGPDSAPHVSRVRLLDFSCSHVTNEGLLILTALLKDLAATPSLQTILLRSCFLEGVHHLQSFLDAAGERGDMQGYTGDGDCALKLVDLSGNTLGLPGFRLALRAMETWHHLGEVLLLNDGAIEEGDKSTVAAQLAIARDLNRHLAFKKVVACVRADDPTTTSVTERGMTPSLARLTGQILPTSHYILSLDFSHGVLDDHAVGHLSNGLYPNPPLKWLNLSHNKITTNGVRLLASALLENTRLEHVFLRANKVDGQVVTPTIELFERNHTLLSFDVSGNKKVPQRVLDQIACLLVNDQPELREVLRKAARNEQSLTVIEYNTVPGLDRGSATRHLLQCNTSLCTLNLDDTRMQDAEAIRLFTSIEQNYGLSTLSLRNNSVTEAAIPTMHRSITLEGCPTLTCVDLAHNPVTHTFVSEFKQFQKLLEVNKCPASFKRIFFDLDREVAQNSAAAPQQGDARKHSTERQTALRSLSSRNMTGPSDNASPASSFVLEGKAAAADGATSPKSRLQHARPDEEAGRRTSSGDTGQPAISHIELSGGSGADGRFHADETAFLLFSVLPLHPSVTSVDLRNNDITDDGAAAIAEYLEDPGASLEELDLSHNKIGDPGFIHLLAALRRNTALRSLRLDGNLKARAESSFLDEVLTLARCNGYPALVKSAVCAWSKGDVVKTLDLAGGVSPEDLDQQQEVAARSCCPVDDEVVHFLCGYIEKANGLVDINLKGNLVGSDGLAHLARACEAGRTLTALNVSDNRIGNDGAVALLRAVACGSYPNLTSVDLSGNDLTDASALHAIRLVRDNGRLKNIDLSRNPRVSPYRLSELNLGSALNHKHPDFRVLCHRLLAHDPGYSHIDLTCRAAEGFFDTVGQGFSADSISLLLSVLQASNDVLSLNLTRNSLPADTALFVAEFLESAGTLQSFSLCDTNIAPALPSLLRSLHHHISLVHVELTGCKATDTDVLDALIPIFKHNSVLEVLDLRENLLTHATLMPIIQTVSSQRERGHRALKALYLYPSMADMPLEPIISYENEVRDHRVSLR
eukprot:gene11388-17519_t